MLDLIEDVIIALLIVWFIDNIIFRGKNTIRFWIVLDWIFVFIFILSWVIDILCV